MKVRNKETKIVILGSYNSGKTTTLENICEKMTKVEYNGTTISLDYGNIMVDGKKVHIFTTPGQERFKFMREILTQGLDGAIVVIDSSRGLTSTDQNIIKRLNTNQIPYVVFANKQDIVSDDLDFNGIDAPIIPTIAREGEGVEDGLNLLLTLIGS
jgi:small GTP-binding protein domain